MNFTTKKNKGKSSSNMNIYSGDIHSVTIRLQILWEVGLFGDDKFLRLTVSCFLLRICGRVDYKFISGSVDNGVVDLTGAEKI